MAARCIADPTGGALGTIGRLGSSIVLVVLAGLAWQQVSPRVKPFALLIAIGMLLGTIGDFFNAGQLNFIPLPDATLGAIGAFGIGHLFYMVGLVDCSEHATNACDLVGGFRVFWQVVGLLSWYLIVYPATQRQPLIGPALGYCLLLAGTAGLATAVACHRRSLWPLALGAILFLISDLILAIGLFRGSFPFRGEAVWLTYGPGQMLIVISPWLVQRLKS